MRTLDWYFDVVSAYAYLQLEQFDRLPADCRVSCKPVLFAGLLGHFGHLGPAEIPSKRLFTYTQWAWRAERLGIPFRMPPAHPFNPLRALRLALALDCDTDAVRAIFRFIWREGRSVEDATSFDELARRLGVDDAETRLAAPAIKEALRSNTERAAALGVFGVPTFVADGEIFWGSDATEMLLDYLESPTQFLAGDLARVRAVPLGSTRKR